MDYLSPGKLWATNEHVWTQRGIAATKGEGVLLTGVPLMNQDHNATTGENAMKKFIAKYEDKIQGVLSGWDRLVLRGSLRAIQYPRGMMGYLWQQQVRLTDFGRHAERVTTAVKEASLAAAKREGRPALYLTSSRTDKKVQAEEIAARDGIDEGLICVLRCVEPCLSYDVGPNRELKRLEIKHRLRKCLFLYHYWMHPEWGFMSARIQSWFPFQVHVYLNGREWLARQLRKHQIESVRAGNCFVWVADWQRAQQLLEEQLQAGWVALLEAIARELNPLHEEIFAELPVDYYWSVAESEWATDISFHGVQELQRLYPRLVRHGLLHFSSPDVMRFLGHKVPVSGQVHGNFRRPCSSDIKRRIEGVRIKHRLDRNSIKMYDKAHTTHGSVVRIETTINNERDFRVFRSKETESPTDPTTARKWYPLRRGIADLHRRAMVSQKANERYIDALEAVDNDATLGELTAQIEQPTRWKGRRVRAIHPLAISDLKLLETVHRGEFLIRGVRNKDLQPLLFDKPPQNKAEACQRSAWLSRQLRLLRAHKILRKIAGRHLYQITRSGHRLLSALLSARSLTANQLIAITI